MARAIKKRIESQKELAESYFIAGEYEKALEMYAKILSEDPKNKEAKIGVLLCDLANEREADAQALFDYFHIIKAEELENAEEITLEIIRNIDSGIEIINSMINKAIDIKSQYIEGIMYKDFKDIVKEKGGFKRAFEDLMFSTKVVFTAKDEFLEFIEELIKNGYDDMAMSYIENFGALFIGNDKVREILSKLENKTIYDHKSSN